MQSEKLHSQHWTTARAGAIRGFFRAKGFPSPYAAPAWRGHATRPHSPISVNVSFVQRLPVQSQQWWRPTLSHSSATAAVRHTERFE
jgi:hypothetical protein